MNPQAPPLPEENEPKYPQWRVEELARKYANWAEDDADFEEEE